MPIPHDDPPLTPEFLARTRPLSVAATALLTLQVTGNLYEEAVTNIQAITRPRPGAMPGELEAGSPVFFYMPWVAIGAGCAATLRIRHGAAAPKRVRRSWNGALACLCIVAAAKIPLVVTINPLFRDPKQDPELLRARARLWAWGNGLAVLAGGTAIALLTSARRLPVVTGHLDAAGP